MRNMNPTKSRGALSSFYYTFGTCRVTLVTNRRWVKNEERVGLWLRQTEHFPGHLL